MDKKFHKQESWQSCVFHTLCVQAVHAQAGVVLVSNSEQLCLCWQQQRACTMLCEEGFVGSVWCCNGLTFRLYCQRPATYQYMAGMGVCMPAI
jgi:hypothetical protein